MIRWKPVTAVLGLFLLGVLVGRSTAAVSVALPPVVPAVRPSPTGAARPAATPVATRPSAAPTAPAPATAARPTSTSAPAATAPPLGTPAAAPAAPLRGTPTAAPAGAGRAAAAVASLPGWELTFEDEFRGATLDSWKWTNEYYWRKGLPELQLYVPDSVRVADGMLHLESRRQEAKYQEQSFGYTSGYVHTQGKFAQQYGRFEVRARLPKGKGVWPAHWLMPQASSWPPEIDIMESLGSDPATVYMSNHWGTAERRQYHTFAFRGPDFSAGFHTFALEWEPGMLRWLVDGELRASTTSGVPAVPMYVILNTAIGGEWPGYPDQSTVLPQLHEIDYVRVYRRPLGLLVPS